MLISALLVVIAIAAWLIWRSQSSARTITTLGNIRGAGSFACQVVGESHYQQNIERIAGPKTPGGVDCRRQAILVLDDDNPHDAKAVRICIDGLTVGHLSREMARSYRAQLKKQGLSTGHYTCEAVITGGWDRGSGDEGHYGVRLDMPVID